MESQIGSCETAQSQQDDLFSLFRHFMNVSLVEALIQSGFTFASAIQQIALPQLYET
jgi:superfamily II DNA/RNA helicase